VLQILNLLVATFGGVFLLSIFGRTDPRSLILQPISEISLEEHRQTFRTLEEVRMLWSGKTENRGFVA
jgi:hypothetical protein